ncbi:thiamine pyrophosphate-binding protein [Nakamurella lactea]|uniref:thiamine pyrophosphate-binding protein n=1 Tax=Nakamurella lactea TaxID=459515 RepID=UPI000411FE01|nr:thiamine pyrophosphate-binding protein [Nakamurella lactea]
MTTPDRHTVPGGEAVAIALEALGVDTLFTVPSAHNLSILRAVEDRRVIRVVLCRHEQGVLHAADGYARATGRLGVAVVSGGPGTANAMGGLYEAHFASSPVLLITSQAETALLGRGRGYVHEAERQADLLRTATAEVVTVEAVDEIAETVVRLGRRAAAGRPRPTAVEIPIDLLDAAVEVDPVALTTAARPVRRRGPDPSAIARAAALLATAERPVIWAGGGVIRAGATDALRRVAEKWCAPVITSREGRGAIDESDPLSIGGYATLPPVAEYLTNCDVLLAVGTRFQMYPTAEWTLALPPTIVHLDVDPAVIGRSYPVAEAVVADAESGLRAVLDALPEVSVDVLPDREKHVAAGQIAAAAARDLVAQMAGPDHLAISRTVSELRPSAGVLVCDATVPAYVWGDRLVAIHQRGTSIRSTSAAIGPGLGLAIGAAVGTGTHAVLLAGDGGFLLGVGELATAVQAAAPLVICLFDDAGYGMLRHIEAGIGDGQLHHVDLATPDFAAVATAFGLPSWKAADPGQFADAFRAALQVNGPSLIHVDLTALAPLRRSVPGPQGETS